MVAEKNGRANANGLVAFNREAFLVIPLIPSVNLERNRFAFRSHDNKFLVAEQDGSLNADGNQIEHKEAFKVTCNKE